MQHIKNLLILLLVFVISSCYTVQESVPEKDWRITEPGCIYQINEVDEFTGIHKLWTYQYRVAMFGNPVFKGFGRINVNMNFGLADSIYYIKLETLAINGNATSDYGYLWRGNTAIFLMEDGSKVNLTFSDDDVKFDTYTVTYKNYITLSKDDVETFLGKSLKKVRLYFSKGYIDFNSVNPTIIKHCLACLKKKQDNVSN